MLIYPGVLKSISKNIDKSQVGNGNRLRGRFILHNGGKTPFLHVTIRGEDKPFVRGATNVDRVKGTLYPMKLAPRELDKV
jgi:hypothetical protein